MMFDVIEALAKELPSTAWLSIAAATVASASMCVIAPKYVKVSIANSSRGASSYLVDPCGDLVAATSSRNTHNRR
jgi:hypothetical protein